MPKTQPDNWVSTTEILESVPYCRHTLYEMVKDGSLRHGYHYLDKRRKGKKRPTYVFSPLRMKEFIAQRPELR